LLLKSSDIEIGGQGSMQSKAMESKALALEALAKDKATD
jgi:hypothetical protein